MRIETVNAPDRRISIELDPTEAGHLISFLMHAKFSDDVNINVVGSPTMNALLRGLISTDDELGRGYVVPTVVKEGGGLRPPPCFAVIEHYLKNWLKRDEVEDELREWLYPFEWIKSDRGVDAK